ncbi:MAG TPA: BTAD domain-containing putative transcriptional regulator [Eubacteriales bacterium]|nr:BTAD domain-containing putative transcriptional regulator [Eubacteriales bacterium]
MPEAKVKIKMFGTFEIIVNGNVVLSQLRQAKKTSQFLEYLILKRDRPVPHEELLEMLWSDKENRNPATALRTLLHRYRALVESSGLPELADSILTARGAYQWNSDLDCEIDVFEFERLCQEARTPGMSNRECIERYLQMLQIYTGPLLTNSAEEMWVVPKSVYYHDLFLESVFTLLDLLKTEEEYEMIIQVCRKAMDVDMFDERLHLELMMALVKTGKKREALSQYYFATDLHYKQLGIQPSGEIRAVYKLIVQADQEMEADIEKVQGMLEEDDASMGAFVCEYEIFKEIYQLQRRMLERYNGTMFLALLTISNTYEQRFDNLVLDNIMKQLLNVAQTNLRRGDTISRYSVMQYVVLLPSVTYETGRLVMDRIKKAFYAEYVKSSVVLTYKLRPLCLNKYDAPGKRVPDTRENA